MNHATLNHATLIFIALLLAACGQADQAGQTQAIPFKPTGDVKHLMQWVLDPAADHVWDSSGSIITAAGTEERAPTTEEAWLAVQRSAIVVAETGNLLLIPGVARDSGAWQDFSLGLIDAGLQAKSAADAHDGDALFEAGAQLYRVCSGCHAAYIQEESDSDIQDQEQANTP